VSHRRRSAIWLILLSVLVNLAGHAGLGAALASDIGLRGDPAPGLVICTPDGITRIAAPSAAPSQTPRSSQPDLPRDRTGFGTESCLFCSVVAGGLTLPDGPVVAAAWHAFIPVVFPDAAPPLSATGCAVTPPARAPPHVVSRSA
jgi:hypothetical protein